MSYIGVYLPAKLAGPVEFPSRAEGAGAAGKVRGGHTKESVA